MRRVRPIRWWLPGGAVLDRRNRDGHEWAVACRPRAAVVESRRRLTFLEWLLSTINWLWFWFLEHLKPVKLVVQILVGLVALIGAILALLAGSWK